MSDDLPISDVRRPASRRSPREAAHRQRQHRIFERLRKRSERGRGGENRHLEGFSTASLNGYPSDPFQVPWKGVGLLDMKFRVEIEQEEDGRWIAEVIDLPGVLAYGSTSEEAQAKVQAFALRVIADRLEHGEAGRNIVSVSFAAG